MPYRSRRSSYRGGRRPHRRLIWAQRTVTYAATANSQWTTVDLLQEYKGATGASSVGVTVMRTHLWVLPHAPAAGDTFWIGLRVQDLDDVATNNTNALIANPRDNPYVDWMLSSKYIYDVNLRVPTQHSSFAGAVIDNHSKRRMEEVQEAYVLTVLQDTVGTVAKTYDVFARVLLALP